MAQALLAAVRDRVSLVRALLDSDAIPMVVLEEELARTAPEAPLLRHPVPLLDLTARLPPHLCSALVAVPVRADTMTGTVDVALADASDVHAAEEIGFYLSAPVRVVRSPLGALESAIAQVKRESSNPPPSGPISVPPPSPVRPVTHTPPWGSPAYVSRAEEHPPTVSERPMPLIPKSHSERIPDGAAERSAARSTPGADIPIPLSRRLTPGAGLVALARAAQELDDEEEPVVELRRSKPASKHPNVLAAEHPPEPPPAPPTDTRVVTQPLTPSLKDVLREMAKVTARDPLMELVLLGVRPAAHKCALFAAKKDVYVGWMCTSDFGDRDLLAQVQIDSRRPSLLATTAAVGSYMGPIQRTETHAPLARFIPAHQPKVLGVTIKAAGRPAVILIAHDVAEPLIAMPVMMEVARVAGEVLERILRAKR